MSLQKEKAISFLTWKVREHISYKKEISNREIKKAIGIMLRNYTNILNPLIVYLKTLDKEEYKNENKMVFRSIKKKVKDDQNTLDALSLKESKNVPRQDLWYKSHKGIKKEIRKIETELIGA
jgi:hypothetical protein